MSTRPHILVIDDDESLLHAVTMVLEHEGYQVTVEGDGSRALDWLLKNEPPAMILLDLRMPGLNGWSIWSRLRFMRGVANVPVILMSGDAGMADRARSIGAAGFLAKPISIEQLLRTISVVAGPSKVMER